MLPAIPSPGRKIRFLLHALYAGWSPITRDTHRHCGIYRSNIKDGRLTLFKDDFFLVLGKQGATLVTRMKSSRREFTDLIHFDYRMKFHRRNPFLISFFGEGKKLFNLEFPGLGLIEPVKRVDLLPLREIHAALVKLLTATGVAPNRQDFLELVRSFVGCQEKAYEAIRAGEGLFWKSVRGQREGQAGNPPIRHYPVLLSKNGPSR